MRILIKPGLILLASAEADDAAARALLDGWSDHVFHLVPNGENGVALYDLGPRPDACREPINVHSGMADGPLQLIGNFAHTPFDLHGRRYASVEGFWQGLKFDDEATRLTVAGLQGSEAKQAGDRAAYGPTLVYNGKTIAVGRPEHWQLMRQACLAKFTQHEQARLALLSTGSRPLTHRMRRDSASIPGVVMADIWMRIRAQLQKRDTQNGKPK